MRTTELAPELGIFIPLASLGLDAADADATNGDGRKVVFYLAKEVFEQFALLGTRPAGMISEKTIPAGVFADPNKNTIRQTFRFGFDLYLDFSDQTFDLVEG